MEIWKPLTRPVVAMDSHNSSSYNNYTSERPDYDNYYSYENSNNGGGSVDEEEGGVDEEGR
jgi:hypothetical protein